jgi:hypothetical protein
VIRKLQILDKRIFGEMRLRAHVDVDPIRADTHTMGEEPHLNVQIQVESSKWILGQHGRVAGQIGSVILPRDAK